MSNSHRHHYIPKFLIKNFLDDEGLLWVYDKRKKTFSKKSPKSIFFEWDRNLFDIGGKQSDNLEKVYAEFDDLLAATVNRVLTTHEMSAIDRSLIIFLAALMKWRVPASDENFEKLKHTIPLERLGIKIRRADQSQPEDKDELDRVVNTEIVKEAKRLLLAIQPLFQDENFKDIKAGCFILIEDKYPALIGDCPMIEASNPSYTSLENFIFPLSSYGTFVYKKGAERYISNALFCIQRDLATFHLAEQYIAGKCKDHLKKIIYIYSTLEKEQKTHLPIKYLFEFVK